MYKICGDFKRFPQLKDVCDIIKAESEWRKQSSLSLSHFSVDDRDELYRMNINQYWKAVLSTLSPCDEPVFSHLKVCISLLLNLCEKKNHCEKGPLEKTLFRVERLPRWEKTPDTSTVLT